MPEVMERHVERLIPEAVHGHLEPDGADVAGGVVKPGYHEVIKPDIDRGLKSLEVLGSEYVNLVKILMLFSIILMGFCENILSIFPGQGER